MLWQVDSIREGGKVPLDLPDELIPAVNRVFDVDPQRIPVALDRPGHRLAHNPLRGRCPTGQRVWREAHVRILPRRPNPLRKYRQPYRSELVGVGWSRRGESNP